MLTTPQTITPKEQPPKFNIERLAKEIDELFQEKLSTSSASYVGMIRSSNRDYLEEVNRDLGKLIDEQKDIAKHIAQSMREQLLAEMRAGRSVIQLPDEITISVGHLDHPETENVVASLSLQRKAMLVGPAGAGKTYMVAKLAEKLEVPFYKYSCSRDSSVHDLLGYKQPRSEEYLNTSFLQAYENGGVFLVDEYDAMSGDMSLFFNGIADNSKFISIPHRDDKPTAVKHKDFYLVMCGNTWGNGSTDYSGRDFQDMALMDRFRFCRHHIGYNIELEKSWMQNRYVLVEALRSSLDKVGSYLSTRNVEDLAILMESGKSVGYIVDMICEDLEEQDKEQVYKSVFNENGSLRNLF